MLKVIGCITEQHDSALLLSAVMVCVIGSWIALKLFARSRSADGATRSQWLFFAGLTGGTAIWSTHFLSMVAFEPGMPVGHEPLHTIGSLVVAIIATSIGLTVATVRSPRWMPEAGGALIGLAIASMHLTGMAGLKATGRLVWDPGLLFSAIVIAMLFGALAINRAIRPFSRFSRHSATAALVLAICGLHFTAMAAVTIVPDPTVVVPRVLLPSTELVLSVVAGTLLVLGTGFATYYIDSHATAEARLRLKTLADAATEGIVILRDGRILDVNGSFERLVGGDRDMLLGQELASFLHSASGPAPVQGAGIECELRTFESALLPVRIHYRETTAPGGQICTVLDLSERKAAEGRIHFLAHFDPLTSLPNRSSFITRLESEIETSQAGRRRFALLCIDLDRFKETNDVFGHAVGDQMLIEIANRMQAALKGEEVVARLGGDEFVALLPDVDDPAEMAGFAERLMAAIGAPVVIDGNDLQSGSSIGIAMFPDDAETAVELMARADLAMYRAKESIGDSLCFFEMGMDRQVREKRAMALDLRKALANGEFELHYQSQSTLEGGEIIGFEALVRWHHPVRGLIAPAEFIPVAEETGLIIPLGNWVLKTACETAKSWPEPYRVAVNISPVQFTQGNLPETVHELLLETGLAPSRLELEITESVLITDLDRALHILRRLKNLGITIAMDDFGTGYSSLSTLQSFPFDKIKIDRSFIDSLGRHHQADSIVRAILALGHSLGIPVLAEGIETKAHLDFLREEGCAEAQGYLLGRPQPLQLLFEDEPEVAARA
ncbi:MAG: EAL domain-containing protein [Parvibaculaceae bacterium]